MKRRFLFQLLLISHFILPALPVMAISAEGTGFSCFQLPPPTCKKTYRHSLAEAAQAVCIATFKSHGCQDLLNADPSLATDVISCKNQNLCAISIEDTERVIKACLKSYGKETLALAKLANELLTWQWRTLLENPKARDLFLRLCEHSNSCKRILVADNPMYGSLSSRDLDWISAKDLDRMLREYERDASRNKTPPNQHGALATINALFAKRGHLVDASLEWLKKQNIKLECFTPEARAALLCEGLAQVIDPVAAAGYAARTTKIINAAKASAADSVDTLAATAHAPVPSPGSTTPNSTSKAAYDAGDEALDRRIDSRIPLAEIKSRDRIKAQLVDAEYTRVKERALWNKLASESDRVDAMPDTLFVEFENSKMKLLNDTTHDPDLVTAMTNKYEQLLMKELKTLRKKYRGKLKFHPYTDFKSGRFAIKGKITSDVIDEMNATYAKVQNDFADWIKENKLVRDEDEPLSWIKMGYGENADWASFAARADRESPDFLKGTSFHSARARHIADAGLKKQNELRVELAHELRDTPLIIKDTDGHEVLHDEVFAILRKAEDIQDAAKQIEHAFAATKISPQAAEKLFDYYKTLDQFSASLRIVDSAKASLQGAAKGGFAIDFAGAGGANIAATARHLAEKTDIKEALLATRQAEQEVTRMMNSDRKMVKKQAGKKFKVGCSGDDCAGVFGKMLERFSDADKKALMRDLTASARVPGKIRISFIPPGVHENARTALSSHGLSIEKVMRKSLKEQIPAGRLDNILFGIDMKTTTLGKGNVDLLLSSPSHMSLKPKEKRLIETEFRNAVEILNTELKKGGLGGYSTPSPAFH